MTAVILFSILLGGCVASWIYWLIAWQCLRSVVENPFHSSTRQDLMVSLLKPVKGSDAEAMENFSSFCRQDYPNIEILFGVADASDPAVRIIEELVQRFPNCSIRLIVCKPLGANPKTAILHQLAAEALGQILILSDSDIRVTEQYVRTVAAPLSNASIGLVTCLYRGQSPVGLTASLAALHMDTTFAPSAALGWKLGTPVGLGATIALRASDLIRAGGFASIRDYLLDDYELARSIVRLGLTVHLSSYIVASVLGKQGFAEQWRREMRWSRGIRRSRPMQYPGLILTFSTPLAALAIVLSSGRYWAWIFLAMSLALRGFVGWRSAKLVGQRKRRYLLLMPVRDLMSAAVWLAAFFGNRVNWRGSDFTLARDGRLKLIPEVRQPKGFVARAIRRLDAHLRRRQNIFEYSDNPGCVLRIAVTPSHATFELSDGTAVIRGHPLGELHLWNEHMPIISRGGPDLAWGMQMKKNLTLSLRDLAHAAESDPRLSEVNAFGATMIFVSRNGDAQVARMAQRYGFEWIERARPSKVSNRIHNFWESFLILALQWTYNPNGLHGKGFIRPREPLWISRDVLLQKYGDRSATTHGAATSSGRDG